MKRIGIYGGSFDPPHMGHIRAARYAVDALCLDMLLVIPASTAPHKQTTIGSPTPQQRLQMLKLCFDGEEKIQVSDLELRRGDISYTYETVGQLRTQYPDAELIVCMGTDMLESFDRWREYKKILQDASLAVFYRGNKREKELLTQKKAQLEALGATVYGVENPVTDISSTQLRRMLVFGCGDDFIDPAVLAFLLENGLYGTGRDYKALPMDKLEQVVTGLLKPDRVAHVLGCRDTAVALARHWGADETDAARAGLLHDITKALDGPLQLTLCGKYRILLDSFSQRYPKTLHALTGSLVAGRIFGENEAVVSAIRSHTTGKADMNTLEKIIYVADYMEPNRNFPGVEQLRHLAFTDLDEALMLGLNMTLQLLKEQGNEVSPESREALAWLERKKIVC